MKKIAIFLSMLLFMGNLVANAQTKKVTGKVTSVEDNMPIPGVSVLVKGTTLGTITDVDGNYSLQVPQDGQTLVFSFVGMVTQEIEISEKSVIDVVMQSQIIGVDEVIVTGYATYKKSEITGSSVQVSGDDLASMPVVSVDQALQGRIAGVNISSASGTPGSFQNIRIRGVSSITAGNEPLFVIDGVPVISGNVSATTSSSSLSALATIDNNNIESITVLKDASATAAYGARGANGVIVITTKSGRAGTSQINFSASYGISNDAIDGPKMLTGAQREMLFYEALINSFGADYGFSDQAGAKAFYEDNPSDFGDDYVRWNQAGRPETNWAKIITNEDAPMQEYNLSATGGKEGYNYYVSGGYLKQEATVIASDLERFTGSVNLGVDLSPSLKFDTKNSASHIYQNGVLENSAYFSSPRTAKYFMPSIDQAYNADGSINYETTSLPNPLWIDQEDVNQSKLTRVLTNNTLTWYTPIKNLTFTTRMNIDYQVYNLKRYNNPLRGDGDGDTHGYGWQASRNRANYVFQNMLEYDLSLDGGHDFNFRAVQEYQKNRLYYLEADADHFSDFGLTNLNSAGNPTTANSWFTDWVIASYMGMVHYSYNGKYVADLTYRREGSSRFADDNRWGNFWAVGGAWNVYKEDFMANLENVLNLFKVRASYGVTGNAEIDLNQYQSLLFYDSNYAGEGASYPGTFGNNDLSWETSYTLDLGFDFGLFQNRLSGSFGYYNRETRDMLLDVPLSLTTGFDEQTRNIGKMTNKGIEVEFNVDIIRSKDFNLSLGGNIATNKNEITELAKDLNGEEINITTTTQRVETGHPLYGWYMPTWAGVDPDTGDEMWYVDGEGSAKTNNFNEANQVWQGGSAIPKLTGSLNLHIDYKGFFVDVNGYYSGGNKIYEGWHRYINGTDIYSVLYYNGFASLTDRWQKPGDVARNGKFEYTGRPWQRHSKYLYDGDYMRLRDLVVGYDFSQSLTQKMGIGGLRVFVRGTNLLTWVKDDYLEYDPEIGEGTADVPTNGQTGMTTPPAKSFIFGVNLKF